MLGSVLETLKFVAKTREDVEDAVHSTCSEKHLENIECSYYGWNPSIWKTLTWPSAQEYESQVDILVYFHTKCVLVWEIMKCYHIWRCQAE